MSTNAELAAQVAERDEELAGLRARLAELEAEAAAAAPAEPEPAVFVPGRVYRDDRLGGGYVLVLEVDDDAVTVARLEQVHQVARHTLELEAGEG